MGLRFLAAKAIGAVSTWGLRAIMHRPAATMPGKFALMADPDLLTHLAPRLREGSILVVGTNGKTSVTNLLADALEASGKTVVCNRTGANLSWGVASSLLQSKGADWGVFETDELWIARVLPHLKSDYVVLLNLFRDQLDRFGEIDRVQASIVETLKTSPETVLVYNGDDPLCAAIAAAVPNRSMAFGVDGSMGLEQNTVADAQMCQQCAGMIEYRYRQYGQLGDYHCVECSFARPDLAFVAENVELSADGASFDVRDAGGEQGARGASDAGVARDERGARDASDAGAVQGAGAVQDAVWHVSNSQATPYLVYNLMAAGAAAKLLGVSHGVFQQAVDAFNPRNGRLQRYEIQGHSVLLNLAKNPTGFNQNLKIIERDTGLKAVAFFVNDMEGDGRDVSWIWDIDFEELANDTQLIVFAGGMRKNDLQVRLKYAGMQARLVDDVEEVFGCLANMGTSPDVHVYAIANYTALPPVHAKLGEMEASEKPAQLRVGHAEQGHSPENETRAGRETCLRAGEPGTPGLQAESVELAESKGSAGRVRSAEPMERADAMEPACPEDTPLVIAHMFPDLLNLYGDGGNVRVLRQRCAWRGLPVEVRRVNYGESADLSQVDLVFLGGGPDREQRLAAEQLRLMRAQIENFVENDGVVLAICGGYQILGSTWLLGDELVEGLSVVDAQTKRPGASADRLIGDVALKSPLAKHVVVGYENHAGRTHLGAGSESFGAVVGSTGSGNNDADKTDGIRYRNVVGTYCHGPLLPKNPEVADWLLARAFERRALRTGVTPAVLEPLDDSAELAANAFMCKRLGV